MASAAVCVQGLRPTPVLSSTGIQFKGESVKASKSVRTRASPSALIIRAAFLSAGGSLCGSKIVRKVSDSINFLLCSLCSYFAHNGYRQRMYERVWGFRLLELFAYGFIFNSQKCPNMSLNYLTCLCLKLKAGEPGTAKFGGKARAVPAAAQDSSGLEPDDEDDDDDDDEFSEEILEKEAALVAQRYALSMVEQLREGESVIKPGKHGHCCIFLVSGCSSASKLGWSEDLLNLVFLQRMKL
jgi:hypothetical protein